MFCVRDMLWIDLEGSSELSEQLQGDGRGLFEPRSQLWASLSPGAEGSPSAQTCSSFCHPGILDLSTEEMSIKMGIAASKPSTCSMCVYL